MQISRRRPARGVARGSVGQWNWRSSPRPLTDRATLLTAHDVLLMSISCHAMPCPMVRHLPKVGAEVFANSHP